MRRSLSFLVPGLVLCPVMAHAGNGVIINEVDADTPGTDVLEFIELYDGGSGNTPLDGLVVVLFNGNGDTSYNAFDLDEFTTNEAGYFILGNEAVPGVDLIFGSNGLQNGADAVALYLGDAADFPNGTAVTTDNLIDALVYDTDDGDDAGLLALLNPDQPQLNENENGNKDFESNQRCPNGAGGGRNTAGHLTRVSTPDAENDCSVPTGACCNPDTGECLDGVEEAACEFDWTEGVLCDDLDPPCGGPPPTGACCNPETGECIDDIEEGLCEFDWTEGVLCDDLDPPCKAPPATGACCSDISGICVDGLTEEDCVALGRRWGGPDSLCDTIDPPCEGLEPARLVISEIVDATLTGGQPKWVEITNCSGDPVDLANYSIGNYNNGGLFLGGGASSPLNAVVLAPGESYVVAYEAAGNTACDPDEQVTCFNIVYGVDPDQNTGPFINGDDVVALFLGLATGDGSDAVLVDLYGVIGVDGSGEPWEYTDGYSVRRTGAGPNDTFDADEWIIAGANSLETGDDAVEIVLIRALTWPFIHICGTEPCAADFDDSGEVDFRDLLQLLEFWGPCEKCPEDIDGDGDVDLIDLLLLLAEWGPCT